MNINIFSAVLAMDTYNRGYDRGIIDEKLESTYIGTSRFVDSSSSDPKSYDVNNGYFGAWYDIQGISGIQDGSRIIAFRGTDKFRSDEKNDDNLYGALGDKADLTAFVTSIGFESDQSDLAMRDYGLATATGKTVTTVGHSLGGGLAGFVAGMHSTQGILFDPMPYHLAVNLNHQLPLPADRFDGISGFFIGTQQDDPLSNWLAYSRDGLSSGDNMGLVQSMLAEDVDLKWTNENYVGQRHSIALNIIQMVGSDMADRLDNVNYRWSLAQKYFYPALFNDSLASQIVGTGNSILGGVDDAHSKLLGVIAYSALESGVEASPGGIEGLAFGNVGIRALIDDMSDIGQFIYSPFGDAYHVKSTLMQSIANIAIQFAGRMSVGAVTVSDVEGIEDATSSSIIDDHAAYALNGALSFVNGSLTVDVSDALWNPAKPDGTIDLDRYGDIDASSPLVSSRTTDVDGLLLSIIPLAEAASPDDDVESLISGMISKVDHISFIDSWSSVTVREHAPGTVDVLIIRESDGF